MNLVTLEVSDLPVREIYTLNLENSRYKHIKNNQTLSFLIKGAYSTREFDTKAKPLLSVMLVKLKAIPEAASEGQNVSRF